MDDTYLVNKRNQLRCGWEDTPEGRIIKIRTDEGEDKCVLVVDDKDENFFVVRDIDRG